MMRSAIVAALLLLATACSGGGDDAATTTEVTAVTPEGGSATPSTTSTSGTTAVVGSTRPPPELAEPFEVVVAFYDTLNAEDVEAMLVLWPSGDRELFLLRTEGLTQKVSATCFPGDTGEGSVRCEDFVGNDDFYGPAGRGATVTVSYLVDDGAIVQGEVVVWPEEWNRYEEAFGAWLETAHPDLFDSAFQGQGDYPFDTAEDALAVIAVLDEFLAQSDEYPVTE